MGVIYLLYNEEGKGYIGQTKNIKKRLNRHHNKSQTRSELLGDFKCEILEECDNDYLADYEQYYYDMYNEMFPNMLVNRNRPSQTVKEWIKKNPEKIKQRQKRYRETHKEQIKIRNTKSREKAKLNLINNI
jgi:hypothetical protein